MPLGPPVEISSVIRRMRGGSQSFLVQASDGAHYVAKFTDNPQGNRSLINECIAGSLLSALGVATPDLAILRLGDSCRGRDLLYFSIDRQEPIAPGLHFGSKCPVDPDEAAIFDFLPRTLYSRVANLDDVGVVFAFDRWVVNTDTRQYIFARKSTRRKAAESKQRNGSFLTAWPIDNGMCFGKDWTLAPNAPLDCHPSFDICSFCDLEQSAALGARVIQSLPDSAFRASWRQIPGDWFAPGDEAALHTMLCELQHRQQGLTTSIQDHVKAGKQHGRANFQVAETADLRTLPTQTMSLADKQAGVSSCERLQAELC
jgi:hypothetical protein